MPAPPAYSSHTCVQIITYDKLISGSLVGPFISVRVCTYIHTYVCKMSLFPLPLPYPPPPHTTTHTPHSFTSCRILRLTRAHAPMHMHPYVHTHAPTLVCMYTATCMHIQYNFVPAYEFRSTIKRKKVHLHICTHRRTYIFAAQTCGWMQRLCYVCTYVLRTVCAYVLYVLYVLYICTVCMYVCINLR